MQGFTTGTCAAAAAKAAAIAVITGNIPSHVEIDTPKGIRLDLEVTGRFEGTRSRLHRDKGQRR